MSPYKPVFPSSFKTPLIFLDAFILVPVAGTGSMHANVKDLLYG